MAFTRPQGAWPLPDPLLSNDLQLMGSPFEELRSPPADRPPPRAPVSRVPPGAPESRVRDPVARVLDPDTASRVGSDLAVAALVELGHSPPKPPAAPRWEERAAPAEEVPVWLQGAGSPSILKKKRSSPRQRGQLAWALLGNWV